jgi:2'-5' RNA ligase
VRITIPEPLRAAVEPVRMKWNPEKAAGNPLHVTIIYHDEAPDAGLLMTRLRAAIAELSPFTIELGPARRFPPPDQGVFLSVTDASGAVDALRKRVLTPPFTPRARFGLHATILHPSAGDRLTAAWPQIEALPALGRTLIDEVQVIGDGNELITRLALPGHPRP